MIEEFIKATVDEARGRSAQAARAREFANMQAAAGQVGAGHPPDQMQNAAKTVMEANDSSLKWEELSIEGKLDRLRLVVRYFADHGKRLTDNIRIQQAMTSGKVDLLMDHTHNIQTGEVTVPIQQTDSGYIRAKHEVEDGCRTCGVDHTAAPFPEGFF